MSDGATPVIALAGVRVAHGAREVLDVPALAVPAGRRSRHGPERGRQVHLSGAWLARVSVCRHRGFRGDAVTPRRVRRAAAHGACSRSRCSRTTCSTMPQGLRSGATRSAAARVCRPGWSASGSGRWLPQARRYREARERWRGLASWWSPSFSWTSPSCPDQAHTLYAIHTCVASCAPPCDRCSLPTSRRGLGAPGIVLRLIGWAHLQVGPRPRSPDSHFDPWRASWGSIPSLSARPRAPGWRLLVDARACRQSRRRASRSTLPLALLPYDVRLAPAWSARVPSTPRAGSPLSCRPLHVRVVLTADPCGPRHA